MTKYLLLGNRRLNLFCNSFTLEMLNVQMFDILLSRIKTDKFDRRIIMYFIPIIAQVCSVIELNSLLYSSGCKRGHMHISIRFIRSTEYN